MATITLEEARTLFDLYTSALVTLEIPTDFATLPRQSRVAVALGIANGRGGDHIFWDQQNLLNEVATRMKDPAHLPSFEG